MGRAPCCEKVGLRRGRWTAEEDQILSNYIRVHGEGSWRSLPKNAGLLRCGKSCRLRWINYLRSNIKRGNISAEEEDTIVKLHASFGNRWSLIAAHLDGRTDNEIKNYWNSHLSRKIIPSTSAIPTKRRISTIKIKKPRKKPSTPSSEIQSNMNPSITTGDEVMHESFTSGGGEKESELGDCFYNESLLMDPTEMLVLTDEDDHVINNMNSSSSSSNDGSQVNQVVNLGYGGDEEDDIMKSWPWENPMEELRVDVKKQDAMIAWLLS